MFHHKLAGASHLLLGTLPRTEPLDGWESYSRTEGPVAITTGTGTEAKRARQSQLEGRRHTPDANREEMELHAQEVLTTVASGHSKDPKVPGPQPMP